VNDLTPYTDLFTDEFLLAHANLYGYNFDSIYYNNLLDLYTTYSDLYIIYGELTDAFSDLATFFINNLQNDFLQAYAGAGDFAGDLVNATQYTENMYRFNLYLDHFTERLDAYMTGIDTLGSLFDLVQASNPQFRLNLPSFNRIHVSLGMWHIIHYYNPDFVFDQHIFQVEPLTPNFIISLTSLSVIGNIPAILHWVYSGHYSSLVIFESSPLNRFATPQVNNLFSLERQVLRSRMRTRRQRHDLRGARTRSRPPSPPSSL
jgi:hypothetical protein